VLFLSLATSQILSGFRILIIRVEVLNSFLVPSKLKGQTVVNCIIDKYNR
jgi:hypothetical protein